MTRPETIKFHLRRYGGSAQSFENDLVAELPGLLITQFTVPEDEAGPTSDRMALRFDFTDDWYSVVAFLDGAKHPTGHYRMSIQTPLQYEDGAWQGDDLILGLEVFQGRGYSVLGEKAFIAAVEDGWMRVCSAANARDSLRRLCAMLDHGCLPEEVMEAVRG